MGWPRNLTKLDAGIFRTTNGNSDELIAVGRCIKAGFACSIAGTTNGRYDAIIDKGKGVLLRAQIKGTSGTSLGFTGGGRSGQQINRDVAQRTYKYTKTDCDLIIGVNSTNGICYIIPIEDIAVFGNSVSLSKLSQYKENWNILLDLN
jgi:hypothetical protein